MMNKIDYRRTTEWKTERVIFPKPLETLYADEPYRSDSIIEYSGWFDTLETRREAIPNGSGLYLRGGGKYV